MAIKGFVIGQLVIALLLLLLLLAVVCATIYFAVQLNECETNQSPFCFAVACPNSGASLGSVASAPCYGYAQRDTNAGTICSSGPQIITS